MKTKRMNIRLITENDWPDIQKIWIDFSNSEYVYYDTWKDTGDEAIRTRIARWAAMAREGTHFSCCLSWR